MSFRNNVIKRTELPLMQRCGWPACMLVLVSVLAMLFCAILAIGPNRPTRAGFSTSPEVISGLKFAAHTRGVFQRITTRFGLPDTSAAVTSSANVLGNVFQSTSLPVMHPSQALPQLQPDPTPQQQTTPAAVPAVAASAAGSRAGSGGVQTLTPFQRSQAEAMAARDGLPPLPESHAPWSKMWNNSAALCTVIRDENLTDIREWLQYHRWLGFDHVYLIENHSAKPIRAGLLDFIQSGFLTYSVMEEPQVQLLAYRRCLQHHREKHNWMAFFDSDEYLALRDKKSTFKDVLNDYKSFPGIAVHWIFMGANGRTTRPEQGGVLRDYTQCLAVPNNQIKIIVNTYFVADIASHPHNMRFRSGAVPVNDARYPVASRWGIGQMCIEGTPNCHLTMGYELAKEDERSIRRLALFHYVTKSLQDFRVKASRGGGTNPNGKGMDFFTKMQRNNQTHDPLCSELAQVADQCCAHPTATAGVQLKQ